MVKSKLLYLIIGIVLISVIIIYLPGQGIKNVDVDRFSDIISSEDVFLINTHTPYIGEIEGTDLIAENWENIGLYLNQLPEDKNAPIAVYCRSGSMSSSAAEQLSNMGYKNIYNLKGGMNAWESFGKEIITK